MHVGLLEAASDQQINQLFAIQTIDTYGMANVPSYVAAVDDESAIGVEAKVKF